MPNDHYISRFLTSRWEEIPGRQLRFYDVEADRFDRCSSKKLFAKKDVNTRAAEGFLNRFIETPVGSYLASVVDAEGEAHPINPSSPQLYRALVGLIRLQVQRLLDARGEGIAGKTLSDWVTKGEGLLDDIAGIESQQHALLWLTLARTESLYFSNLGAFVVPLTGEPPAVAVPLTPRHLVCLAPFGEVVVQQLRHWAHKEGTLSAFSIGVGMAVRQVVIPPVRFQMLDRDPQAFRDALLDSRLAAQKVFDLVGQMSAAVGLPAWSVTR